MLRPIGLAVVGEIVTFLPAQASRFRAWVGDGS